MASVGAELRLQISFGRNRRALPGAQALPFARGVGLLDKAAIVVAVLFVLVSVEHRVCANLATAGL